MAKVEEGQDKKQQVKVNVDYLPATEDYKEEYAKDTVVETVRTDAKNFFGVQDRQERDTYFYYLTHKGARVEDTNVTLDELVTGKSAHLTLVEQITAGAS